MNDELKQKLVDSYTQSETRIETFTASKNNSSVRLECIGFGSEVLKIHERTSDMTLKLDYHTMECLAVVLSKWLETRYKP